MSTPIPSWVASWLIVIRNQPAGNWIIRGMEAWLIGGMFGFKPTPPDNDNGEVGMSENMRDAIVSELRHIAGKLINGEISDGDIAASLLSEAAELLASSPAQEPVATEPVAWTNEAQLGFLKEPGYRVVPMAMWAFQHSAHPIALYATPAPPQPGREWPEGDKVGIDPDLAKMLTDSAVYVQTIRDNVIEECLKAARDGFEDAMKNYALIGPSGMAMQMINSIRALTGEPK